MSVIFDKLSKCRVSLCDAELDLMDFEEGIGYLDPSDPQLLFIYKQIVNLIDTIVLISD